MYSDRMSHGPTLFYPPPPTTQYFPASRAHCTTYSPSPEPPQARAFARPPVAQQRSRKRSRDQLEDDERQAVFEQENTMDIAPPAPEPIYGEGMIIIDPVTRRPIGSDASSSTGTWAEQQLEEERRAAAVAAEQAVRDDDEMARALDRPAKASRLDIQSVRSGSPTTIAGLVAPTPLTPETPSAPVYDEAAMALGIGWRKIDASTDAALAGASKGWAKYIDNHFGQIEGAEILAKNTSDAYFVKARDVMFGGDAWYLFDGDLHQGRLLARDIDGAVRNLNLNQFEGELMISRVSPEPASFAPSAQTSLPTEIAMEM